MTMRNNLNGCFANGRLRMENAQGPQGHDDDWLMSRFLSPKAIPLTSNHEWDESNGKLGVRNVRRIGVSGL